MKNRVIVRAIIDKYLTQQKNDKALHEGLQIVTSLLHCKRRQYSSYSKISRHDPTSEHLFERVIGSELMKLCLELNLFPRMSAMIGANENISKHEDLELLNTIVNFLRSLLKSQKPSYENVVNIRTIPLLRLIVKQGINS